jgi:metallophosphoesterase superfamily enzyme
MAVADLHFSVGSGECRDTDKTPCVGDAETLKWLGEALDAEKPDLVVCPSPAHVLSLSQVFSGDQLNGQQTSYDARSVSAKFTKPVIDRQIPWAAIFGNHDSEIAEDRAEQMRALGSLPYSLAKPGPSAIDGVGNCTFPLSERS